MAFSKIHRSFAMTSFKRLKIASAVLLTTLAITVQAAPDWSLIITGPGIVVPPAPAPVQVAPVRVAPIVVAPPPPTAAPAQVAPVQGYRPNTSWESERERERDRYFQDRFNERFQERENYYLERERAFIAREKAFLEREKQRQLVVENNRAASQAVNNRQDQLLDQIVEGVNLGRVDRDEFADLMAQQKVIRDKERAYLADGFMAQDEFNALNNDLNNTEQAIRFATRPDRPRRDRGVYYVPQPTINR
jgi:hypothetical protein